MSATVEAKVREAVIRENLRWEGVADWETCPLPEHGAAKVYVSDVARYVRVGIASYLADLRDPALPLPPKAVAIPPTVIGLSDDARAWSWFSRLNSGGGRQYIGVCCALDAEEILPASVVIYSRLVGTNDAGSEREWFVARPGRQPIALRDWWAK